MEDIQKYTVEFELSNKKLLEDLKRFEKKMKGFEDRRLKADKKLEETNKKSIKSTQILKTKAAQDDKRRSDKALTDAQKQFKKEELAKKRQLEKEKQAQVKFDSWKLRQLRSDAYQRLSLEQQMNIKRVLSAKKSEQEIREEFELTSSKYKREIRQRNSYERKQAAANRKAHATGGKGASGGGVGVAMLLANPAVMGVAMATVGSALTVKGGADDFKILQQASVGSGASVKDLQKEAFINQSVLGTEFSSDKTAQILIDMSDKMGELNRDLTIDKEGKLAGGGGGVDAAQYLVDQGVIANNEKAIKEYFSGDALKVQRKLFADLERTGADANTISFVTESLASDLSRVYKARQDTQKVQAAEKNYTDLNIGLSDDDITRMDKVSAAFATMAVSLASFPLNVFNGFTESLSPESQANLKKFGELLAKLSKPIGKLIGILLDLTLTALTPLLKYTDAIVIAFNSLVDALKAGADMFVNVRKTIVSFFGSLISGIFDALTSAIPDFLLPDDFKKDTTSTVSNTSNTVSNNDTVSKETHPTYLTGNTTPVQAYNGYNSYITPPTPQQSINTTQKPVSVNVNGEQTTNVVLTLDGAKVAESVSKSPLLQSQIESQLYPHLNN